MNGDSGLEAASLQPKPCEGSNVEQSKFRARYVKVAGADVVLKRQFKALLMVLLVHDFIL